FIFFFQAEDGIRDRNVTGVQTCALPILDYLLLDLPPGTGDIAMDVHELLPTCNEVIVTTPHPTAAFVAARAGQMALKTDHKILGVVENMAYFESEKTGE